MYKERLISGLFGSMFIIIFQPFGLLAFGTYRWLLIAGICVCIVCSILLAEVLLTWVLRLPHDPGRGMKYLLKRNVIFQVLNILLMTVSTVFFLDQFCCMEGVDNHLSWPTTLSAFFIYVGSSLVIGLYWRNVYMKRDYRRQLEESQYLNGILQERQRIDIQKQQAGVHVTASPTEAVSPEAEAVREITLSGTTKESLTLLPQDFFYAEADGNYVHVHYRKAEEIRESMLRCSISQVEETMSVDQNILRCHRAFVVNLKHVSKLESHGSTLQLFFREAKALVPVSKTYMQIVKERIVEPRK